MNRLIAYLGIILNVIFVLMLLFYSYATATIGGSSGSIYFEGSAPEGTKMIIKDSLLQLYDNSSGPLETFRPIVRYGRMAFLIVYFFITTLLSILLLKKVNKNNHGK
jgi:hypothetical protein